MTGRALVVCAHPTTRDDLVRVVGAAGLTPLAAPDGESALYLSTEHLVDAVVIAPDLPGIGALEVCRELRRRGRTAIVVVSAGGERRRLAALEAGADDHVDLPYHRAELAARLRALVRRTAGPLAVERRLRVGPVVVHVSGGAGTIGHPDRDLAAEDATVLGALAERPGCVVPRAALRERLAARHGREAADHLDECVARLAGELDAAGAPAVQVVEGVGLVLRP